MLAVVTSAVRGTTTEESVLHTIWSLYPNIQPLVWLKPHLASVSIPEWGNIPSFMDDTCQTWPLSALRRVLSIARMYGLTKPSETNRFAIAVILSLISVEMVFNRLSNVRLLGRYDSTTDNPQAFITFLLYGKSIERKWCSDLLESSLNHIRTIKQRRIMVVE